jgi:hypothetical protein
MRFVAPTLHAPGIREGSEKGPRACIGWLGEQTLALDFGENTLAVIGGTLACGGAVRIQKELKCKRSRCS